MSESKSLAIRQAALRAETSVEQLFAQVQTQLHALNLQLLLAYRKIREAQPRGNGSVCLELHACGPGCRGCPHPRWVRYVWTTPRSDKPPMMLAINLDAAEKDPILVLSRKAPEYPVVSDLIREAKAILKKRAKLLSAIKSLSTGLG